MMRAVVLDQSAGSVDAQVCPRDDLSVLIQDRCLHVDWHLARRVQQSKQRFPRRLRPPVQHRHCPTEARCTSATLPGRVRQVINHDVTDVQRTVTQDDEEVEKPEVAGGCEQDLGGLGDRQSLDPHVRDLAGVSSDVQSRAPWSPAGIGYGHEHGQGVR